MPPLCVFTLRLGLKVRGKPGEGDVQRGPMGRGPCPERPGERVLAPAVANGDKAGCRLNFRAEVEVLTRRCLIHKETQMQLQSWDPRS